MKLTKWLYVNKLCRMSNKLTGNVTESSVGYEYLANHGYLVQKSWRDCFFV